MFRIYRNIERKRDYVPTAHASSVDMVVHLSGGGFGFFNNLSHKGYTRVHMGMMQYLKGALSLDGTLDKEEIERRTQFLVCGTISLCSTVVGFTLTMHEQMVVSLAGSVLVIIGCLVGMGAVLCKVPLHTGIVMLPLYAAAAGVMLWDFDARTLSEDRWAILVLIIDMLLVMRVPTFYTSGLVGFVVLWLVLLGVEESFRFGLYDLPGLPPQEGEYGRKYYHNKVHECGKLPCPQPFPPSNLIRGVSVFVIDFIITRGFAREVLKEQASMERTINAVQEIASLLAKYDVEGVARMLAARGSELPEEMYETLQTMEQNLRRYKPYLPAALFEEMEEEDGIQQEHKAVAPPGEESETATIVFTDIRASTSMWEHAPEGMRAGLKIHNTVIREAMQMFGGYEVKTIGDSFMVAFTSTQDGVNFGLRVHELLREAVWPDSLLEDAPICAEQGPLWGGLTVRIGVNTGPVTVEQNALTGRTDYFGHTVNVAARLESTCKPGAVAVPCDLYTSECVACSAVVGDAEALDLKGVSGTTFVCCVWPLSLAGRKHSPLKEPSGMLKGAHGVDVQDSDSASTNSTSLCADNFIPSLPFDATVGTVHLAVGDECDPSALHNLSLALSTLTVALDQNGGTLVTLLGSRVCVGWNLTRPAPAHMENAVRFAQRLLGTAVLSGAGLVTGSVQHGDVGARKQRFVTVMGQTVYRSWALCDTAREGRQCLYEPPFGTVLPAALKLALQAEGKAHDGLYHVIRLRISLCEEKEKT